MPHARTSLRHQLAFSCLALAALASAAAIWFGMPHERSIPNVGVLLVKLIPFVLAVEAIAQLRLSPAARSAVGLVAIPFCFLVYFTYFVPRIFFEEGEGNDGVYYLLLTVTPFLTLSLVLAYRLGGGAAGKTRRLGYALILLQLSGLEDLGYIMVNPHTDPDWMTIPAVWTWADHMTVFVGRPLTRNEAFLFIAIHVVLALLVLFLPGRFLRRLAGRGETAATGPSGSVAAKPAGEQGGGPPPGQEQPADGERVAASPGP